MPTELFQVHDLATGRQKRVVRSDHERVTAEVPGLVWTAGQPVPFKVQSSNAAARWRVWATALGDSDWRELKRSGGATRRAGGLCRVVSASHRADAQPASGQRVHAPRGDRGPCAGQPGHRECMDAAQPHLVGPRRSNPGECGGAAGECGAGDFAFIAGVVATSGAKGLLRKRQRFFASLRRTSCGAMWWAPSPFPPRSRRSSPPAATNCAPRFPASPAWRSRFASGRGLRRGRRSASRCMATMTT